MTEKKTTPKYTVVLNILGTKHEATGDSIEAALVKFDWKKIKGSGEVIITKGNKKHTHLMNRAVLSRILVNKLARVSWAKNMEYLLKEDVKTNIPEIIINKQKDAKSRIQT